jgi:hygromycin-B 4-O-kinase
VLRINPSLRGFEKDRWAAETVGERVPVPAVAALGQIDGEHAYCITDWAPGVTLEDLPDDDVAALVAEVHAAWAGIAGSDVSAIDGFGDFDAQGEAAAASWREVLLGTFDAAGDASRPLLATYRELIERCPEERGLVHGDFGSDNVLAHAGRISAILDWDNTMVGDPLYDVANTRFWSTYLSCMQVQADHFDRVLGATPDYDARVICYALRIGIEEVRGGGDTAAWALARCRELIAS